VREGWFIVSTPPPIGVKGRKWNFKNTEGRAGLENLDKSEGGLK
jgi:hypothetical protein